MGSEWDDIVVSQRYCRYDQYADLRGLQIILGWQLDRMACILPVSIAWTWFGFGIALLGVIAWAGPSADWATAMAFGQFLVASITLLFVHL